MQIKATDLQAGDVVWARAQGTELKGMVGRFVLTAVSPDGFQARLADITSATIFEFNAQGYMTCHQPEAMHRLQTVARNREHFNIDWE